MSIIKELIASHPVYGVETKRPAKVTGVVQHYTEGEEAVLDDAETNAAIRVAVESELIPCVTSLMFGLKAFENDKEHKSIVENWRIKSLGEAVKKINAILAEEAKQKENG